MFYAAARVVAESVSEAALAEGTLLPPLETIREISVRIAGAVAQLAVKDGLARVPVPDDTESWVRAGMYQPVYHDYVPAG
jgi:malate dehydrogenase (oxaloacetate-decarboxylating)(NADP+)